MYYIWCIIALSLAYFTVLTVSIQVIDAKCYVSAYLFKSMTIIYARHTYVPCSTIVLGHSPAPLSTTLPVRTVTTL